MKVYSIGREVGCDIVINDNTDVISRRHAVLNIMSSGKMTIVDQSHNGTYVNGIRISPNVPVPVTRKDNISFAHVARLDWNLVPKPAGAMLYVIIAVIALFVVVGGVIGYSYLSTPEPQPVAPQDTVVKHEEKKDTLKTKQEESQKPVQQPQKPVKEKSCPTCKKKISACEYQGKHPQPEKKCETCGKTLKECKYQGKHPANPTTRGDR